MPQQITSVNLAVMPFISSCDSTRANMSAKQFSQSLTNPNCEIPFVISNEYQTLVDSSTLGIQFAKFGGQVLYNDNDILVIYYPNAPQKLITYRIPPFKKTTSFFASCLRNSLPQGSKFNQGDILYEYDCFRDGIPSSGYNVNTAYCPFFGFNHEDALTISESFAQKAKHQFTETIYIPIYEFTLLQKIIEEFINRQNETNTKINELEKKINYLKNVSNIPISNNYSPKDNNYLLNNIIDQSFDENDLNEKEEKNNENKQNIEKEGGEEKEEEKENKGKDNLDKENMNKEENTNVTLLQSSKNESKKTKFLFQQVLSKVNILENKHNELLEQFNSNNKEYKKEVQSLKNKNKESTTKITELENMIKEMQNKKEEEIDEMKIINDDEENVEIDQDKVKIWIKNLEQKLTKKIEFSDKRNKNNEGSLNELKNEINDLKNKLNNLESMLSSPNEKEDEKKENEQSDEEKKEGRNIFDDLAKKEELNQLKNEFQHKIDEVNDNISKNPLLNIDEKKLYESIIPKLSQMTQNLKENVQKSIENNEKYVKNQIKKIDIDSIKAEMASMKKELKNKLNKENLGSINLKIEDMENIEENLRTLIDDNRNDIRQCNDKYAKIFKVLETLRGQVLTLFDDEETKNKKDTDESKIDWSLLVSRQEYDEDKEKMNKKIEKIYLQETDNYRIIQEIQRKIRNLVTETDLQNVEQYLLNLLNENKIKISKTYVEKMEHQKNLKLLELRIKTLEETASKENENWLLAKKPINGFLCASCEAYIGDLKNNEEIATWNKLTNKKDRKNYRIGHGFSTMLKMINTDLLKRLEKEKENINNHSVINNSHIAKSDDIKKINKNLPKINLTNQININETQNMHMNMNMNNSHSDEVNDHLNNSSNNLNSHTQINFDRNFLNIKGQLSDRAINKNVVINNFNKDIIDNLTSEELHPKVIKIAKKSKKA